MATRIVAASAALAPETPGPMPGVTKTSTWRCDVFTGIADALIAAGVLRSGDLEPQKGRPDGRMVILPNGEPCPPSQKAWREPGHKSIWRREDGTYEVEVTVTRELQAARRKIEAAEEHEREQLRIDKDVQESGQKYRNWKLLHGFGGDSMGASWQHAYEWWEGTKEQLQREGIGVGLKFPGEPGAPKEIHCKCPLGFEVRIYQHTYPRAKSAAGIYTAQSWYVPRTEDPPKQYVQHAPGVLREVWDHSGWSGRDYFYGTAAALVSANLVPALDLFPGQPGRNKMQASYRTNWTPTTSSPHQAWGATIRMRGKGNEFCLELPVSDTERTSRDEQIKQRDKEIEERTRVLCEERKKLRQLAPGGLTIEEFRAKRAEDLEPLMQFLWLSVFRKTEGLLSFDMPEDSDAWEELARAFQTLRDLVAETPVIRDEKLEAQLKQRQKLTAARNDRGLQSVLHDAKHLRLVHSDKLNPKG